MALFAARSALFTGALFGAALSSSPGAAAEPNEPVFTFGVGAIQFALPPTEFNSIQDSDTSSTVAREVDHNGSLNGAAYDASLEQLLTTAGDWAVAGRLEGFFASASGTQTTDCVHADPLYCYIPALVDDPLSGDGLFSTLDGETFHTVAARSLDAWGVAAGAMIGRLKPAPGAALQFGGGFDFRHFGQSLSLDSVFVPQPDEIYSEYDEKITTDYVGAYLATRAAFDLWHGASFSAAGRIGVYSADAHYSGAELQVFPDTPDDNYSLTQARRHTAFIASARGELSQMVGPVTLALFNDFEWYSWAPAMKYNDNDQGYPGMQVGTEMGDGSMWSNTFGVRARVSF